MAQAPDETRPLYQQVVDAIEAKIASGELGEDDKIPSAKTLAETHGVASMTAQRALRELQNRGIIYGIAGRGSYVNPAAVSLLTSTAKPITSDAEYHAVMAQLRHDVDAAHTAMDQAIAGGDIDQILKARTDQEQ
ncbi:MAG TPA: winged helix-turn-helix domain-containing protein, partial [Streptosporangiaceae bacterium]|nr:winged helix-turn-helix domain-containing protein [Streptosporangiaceae bacterium]